MANPDPGIAVQVAVYAALLASPDAAAVFIGIGRPIAVYSRVPDGALLPYYTIGDDDIKEDQADEIDGSEVYVNVHSWSGAATLGEVKGMANAARAALDVVLDLSANGHVCVLRQYLGNKPVGVPDGETEHRVVTVKYLTEPLS